MKIEKMVIIITKKKNKDGSISTSREKIGADLEKEEIEFVYNKIREKLI